MIALEPEVRKKAVDTIARFKSDFPLYARKCLRIKPKSGGANVPLILNRAQEYVHERLEEQKARTGKVRALILKGRQQGISTYIEGRFFHATTFGKGIATFILTHMAEATANLFDMAERFYKNVPALVRPHIGALNARELSFDNLESGYKVATAGSSDVGRSATIQRFHGSEVAFWPNAVDHAAGALQTVPNEPGTEIILESTANGYDLLFHQMWQDAVKGESEYIAIFVPWFWQPEYRLPVPDKFTLDPDETEYMELYGLGHGQMAWRREKIRELRGLPKFRQEYPATAEEAFQLAGFESYIPADLVEEACKRKKNPHGNVLLIGVDPAERETGDDTAICFRSAGHIEPIERHKGRDPVQAAGIVTKHIKESLKKFQKVVVFVDSIGIGSGVVATLKENGWGSYVRRVDSRRTATKENDYHNKRSEIAGEFLEYLKDGGDLPDDPLLKQECVALGYGPDGRGRMKLESKDSPEFKKRGGKSPDGFDAICLTFAEPVYIDKNLKPIKGAEPDEDGLYF